MGLLVHYLEQTSIGRTIQNRENVSLSNETVSRATSGGNQDSPSFVLAFFDIDLTIGTV